MDSQKYSTKDVLMSAESNFHPGFSVDCVIIAFHEGILKVLLNKHSVNDKWMLPGGFVHKEEDVDDAVHRTLKNRTGLSNVYLKQFHLFGKHDRNDNEFNRKILELSGITPEEGHWYLQRFVSLGYYAFVQYDKVEIATNDSLELVEWFPITEIPPLYLDHNEIIEKAIKTIRLYLGYVPIGYKLLPEKFTMPELRLVYESILGRELDRRNFQRKMLSIGLFDKLDEKRKSGAHKSPYLYSFNVKQYEKVLKDDLPLVSWSLLL